jgi:hypothetical protein
MGVLNAGLDEAIASCDSDYAFPCVVTRSDDGVSLITFRLGDFMDMYFDKEHWED